MKKLRKIKKIKEEKKEDENIKEEEEEIEEENEESKKNEKKKEYKLEENNFINKIFQTLSISKIIINKNIINNIVYFHFGSFVYFLYFFYRVNNLNHITILFLFENIFLYFFENKYCYYFVVVCYLIISLMIDCFHLKYFLPFFASVINERIKKYFIFINLFLIVDFNLYSILFMIINIFFQLTRIGSLKKRIYLFNFFSLFIFLLTNLDNNSFKIYFYIFIFLLLIFLLFEYINKLISGIVFILFYFYHQIYNDNLKYELNEKGYYLIFLMYSNLLSLILARIFKKIFNFRKKKRKEKQNKIISIK